MLSDTKTEGGASAPSFHVIDRIIETHSHYDNSVNERNMVSALARGLPEFFSLPETGKYKERPLAIIGGGWSLKDTLHEIPAGADIMVCGTAHDFVARSGIKPTWAVHCDGDPRGAQFYQEQVEGCKYLIASNCDPILFDRLAGRNCVLWHTGWALDDDGYKKLKIEKRVGGGCTVMLNALPIAILLGYNDLHFFGMDSCKNGTWHSYEQLLLERDEIQVTVDGAQDGRIYVSTPEMVAQAQQFQTMVNNMGHMFAYEVHGDGLIAGMVRHSKTIAELSEKEKYEKIWSFDVYRKVCPGEEHVSEAYLLLGMKDGDSLIDFGCGTGRASAVFQKMGLDVTGVDFASNCLDPQVSIPLVVADLDNMPALQADWGYCTDVMEHVPPNKVTEILFAIHARVRKGAFFSIATYPDNMGALIGAKLHLTVEDIGWWTAQLEQFWIVEKTAMTEKGNALFVCRNKEGTRQ